MLTEEKRLKLHEQLRHTILAKVSDWKFNFEYKGCSYFSGTYNSIGYKVSEPYSFSGTCSIQVFDRNDCYVFYADGDIYKTLKKRDEERLKEIERKIKEQGDKFLLSIQKKL
jgi:hypothetical protein